MKLRKQKLGVLIGLLFISIAFAAVTTILVIDGTISIGSSNDTFDEDVIFTKATTNSGGIAYISPDGKSITYSSSELTELGEEATLDFEITNKSRIYDANAVIECTTIDETNIYNDYVSITTDPDEFNILAGNKEEGILKIKLIKSYSGDGAEIKFSCKISANAVERDSEADEITIPSITDNVVSGYLFDENGNPLVNVNIVIMSDKLYYATTDENGYYEVAGLSSGSYPVYIMKSDKTLEEIKEMNNQEVKDNSITKGQLTTGEDNITFDNNYKQESNETVTKYTITFNANGGSVETTSKELIKNAKLGTLPTPTREGYTFDGWYTEATNGNIVTNETRAKESQILYAHWTVKSYATTIGAGTGGSVSTTSLSVNYGGSKTFTITPSTGYYLSGVSCTNGYTTNAQTGTGQTSAQTVTLSNNSKDAASVCTVAFTPITYSISYTMNSGTNNSSNPSSYNIESSAITLKAPTRTGYTFTGWTGSNGSTKQTSVTIAKGSTGNKSYTANWSVNSYNVSLQFFSNHTSDSSYGMALPTNSITYKGSITKSFDASNDYFIDKDQGIRCAAYTASGTFKACTPTVSCTNGYTADFTWSSPSSLPNDPFKVVIHNNGNTGNAACTVTFTY